MQWSRNHWAIAVAITGCWTFLLIVTSSAVEATVLFAVIAGLGIVSVLAFRALNVIINHPQLQQLADGGHDGPSYSGLRPSAGGAPVAGGRTARGMPTVTELTLSLIPVLRLVTGDSVTQTQISGARAGRGAVELELPEVPTVSRQHARFTFSDGQWRIANLGMNGLMINGSLVAGEHPLGDGDSIRWGSRPDSLLSQVEIIEAALSWPSAPELSCDSPCRRRARLETVLTGGRRECPGQGVGDEA